MQTSPDPTEWVDLYGDLLFGYAYSKTQNNSVAEDIVQETLLRGIQSLNKFKGKSSLKSWLMGILKNVIRETSRKQHRTIGVDDIEKIRDDAIEDSALSGEYLKRLQPSEAVERIEFWELVQKCLDKLPEKTAQVFWEREVEGVPSLEIEEKHNISQGNIWIRIHRARQFLKECVADVLGINPNDPKH